ncbi:MAG: peptidoglycan-binding domain-containing protein [Chloroflexi bacterium]|nr:peptidoglycan-binding domain-containing protein [Chloroflexota bacterium]
MRLRRRGFLLMGAAVLILGGAIVGSGLLTAEPAAGQPAANPALLPATAQITRTRLVETRTEAGTLGYGDPVPVRASGTGTLTWIAVEGSIVMRGDPLFKIDELPVVALYGAVPMYRTLSKGVVGADVRQLQENLLKLGYTGFAADGIYTQATTAAVLAWQADLGLSQTGMVEPAQIVFTPGPARIAEHVAGVGDLLGSDRAPILNYTDTARIVTVALNVVEQALAVEGGAVTVTLPDERTVAGVIAKVSTVVKEEKFDVTVTMADQAALGPLQAAPVDVDFISATREDVLTVPVAALLALAEGGYGVEIVEGNTTRIVAIKTGMFADGRVEVSGEAIAEGMMVGVPR